MAIYACLPATCPASAEAGDFGVYMHNYRAARSAEDQVKMLDAAIAAWTYGDGSEAKMQAFLYRGNAYSALNLPGNAVADFTSALNISPSQTGVLLNRGLAHCANGNYNAAMNDYSAALKEPRHAAGALLGIGSVLMFTGDLAKAGTYFDAAERASGGDKGWILAYNRGLAYYLMGKYNSALAMCDRVTALNLEDQFLNLTYILSGYVYYEKGDYVKSGAAFRNSLKLNPYYWIPLVGAGLSHSARNEEKKAGEYLLRAEKSWPGLKEGSKVLEKLPKSQFPYLSAKVKKGFDSMHLLLHYGDGKKGSSPK